MNQLYTQLIDTLISVGIPCLVGALFAAVKRFVGTQKVAQALATIQTKSHLANEAVLFAEDAFKELGGPAKLTRAKESLIDRLNVLGIPVTEDEADALARAAYQTVATAIKVNAKIFSDSTLNAQTNANSDSANAIAQ